MNLVDISIIEGMQANDWGIASSVKDFLDSNLGNPKEFPALSDVEPEISSAKHLFDSLFDSHLG